MKKNEHGSGVLSPEGREHVSEVETVGEFEKVEREALGRSPSSFSPERPRSGIACRYYLYGFPWFVFATGAKRHSIPTPALARLHPDWEVLGNPCAYASRKSLDRIAGVGQVSFAATRICDKGTISDGMRRINGTTGMESC